MITEEQRAELLASNVSRDTAEAILKEMDSLRLAMRRVYALGYDKPSMIAEEVLGESLTPSLYEPCPVEGRHGWQCCQSCGANGPDEGAR